MKTQNGPHAPRDADPESPNGLAPTGQTPVRAPSREQEPPRPATVPESFHILESTAPGRHVIAPCGELDLSNAARLKERLAGNLDTVLDLSELSFIDSTGIHLLLNTAQRAQSDGWEFTVRNPQPAVLRVIKLVRLEEHLRLENQSRPEEDAKQAFPLT